jgi:hypothetical protein
MANQAKKSKLKPTDQIRKQMEWPTKVGHGEPKLIDVVFKYDWTVVISLLLDHIDSLEARIAALEAK